MKGAALYTTVLLVLVTFIALLFWLFRAKLLFPMRHPTKLWVPKNGHSASTQNLHSSPEGNESFHQSDNAGHDYCDRFIHEKSPIVKIHSVHLKDDALGSTVAT
ncbi:unnamed protein product [Allacma fusca]|uniref:Uncharacterized protein n=1 Tax=Allacma fusca TaxID=39272 RepID=A0A8J2KKM0_9HEXA|nr:unnamed protein product [Allacma fusca]